MQDTGQPETIAAPGEKGVVIKPEKTDISKNLTIFALYTVNLDPLQLFIAKLSLNFNLNLTWLRLALVLTSPHHPPTQPPTRESSEHG